jgi:hypothetical protein
MILRHHKNAFAVQISSQLVISLRMVGDAMDNLNHSGWFTGRCPTVAVDFAAAPGIVLECRSHNSSSLQHLNKKAHDFSHWDELPFFFSTHRKIAISRFARDIGAFW